MAQDQSSIKRLSGVGIVATFGFVTLSSGINHSITSTAMGPDYRYEAQGFFNSEDPLCNSSMLSKQSVGDIVLPSEKEEVFKEHEKIDVVLKITKISKHVSSFDFEDDYEEI